jgi:outer membrane protein assembly factor BamB
MNSQTDWYTRMGNAQRTGHVSDTFVPPLRLAWKYERGDYVWSGPVIAGNRVYVTGSKLHALELETGDLLWQSERLKAGGLNSATVWNDLIFVAGDDHLFGIDAQTGKTRLKLEGGIRDASPCVHQGMVYWPALRGKLHAADIATGDIRWTYNVEGKYVSTKFTPVALGNSVFCASSGRVYALDAGTGELRWEHRFDENVDPFDTAAIYEGKLIVPFVGVAMFAFDIDSGAVQWQSEIPPHTAPSVAEETVYFASAGGIYAVSSQSGKTIWVNPDFFSVRSAPIVVGDYLFMGGDTYRRIYAFDRQTGQMVWEYPTDDLVYSTPAYAHGRLVIGSHDGYVYCFEEDK